MELIQNFWSAKYKIQNTKKKTLREKVAIWNVHNDIGTASHLTWSKNNNSIALRSYMFFDN